MIDDIIRRTIHIALCTPPGNDFHEIVLRTIRAAFPCIRTYECHQTNPGSLACVRCGKEITQTVEAK